LTPNRLNHSTSNGQITTIPPRKSFFIDYIAGLQVCGLASTGIPKKNKDTNLTQEGLKRDMSVCHTMMIGVECHNGLSLLNFHSN